MSVIFCLFEMIFVFVIIDLYRDFYWFFDNKGFIGMDVLEIEVCGYSNIEFSKIRWKCIVLLRYC